MTKLELKRILSLYSKIRRAVLIGESTAVIEKYGRKKSIEIPSWAYGIEKSICSIMRSGDEIVRQITEKLYLKGYKDHEVYMDLPVSESGFYRIKKSIEERIYEMCIVYGYVTENEIISNII